AHAQIMVSAATHPTEIEGLDPSLQSGLLSGLLVEIPPPPRESLLRILAAHGRRLGCDVPEDVLEEIVAAAAGDSRRAAQALRKIIAFAAQVRKPLTLDLVAGTGVGAEIRRDPGQRARSAVERLVLEQFPVKREVLYSKRKLKSVQVPRRICMH